VMSLQYTAIMAPCCILDVYAGNGFRIAVAGKVYSQDCLVCRRCS
jgi:hypothetical protein